MIEVEGYSTIRDCLISADKLRSFSGKINKQTYTCLSGRQTLKPRGSNAFFSFENNQSLAAKPPTKNTHYKSCEEHMFFID